MGILVFPQYACISLRQWCDMIGHYSQLCGSSKDDHDDLLESPLALKDTLSTLASDDQNNDRLEEEDFVHSSE
jgi:hypothetical protein